MNPLDRQVARPARSSSSWVSHGRLTSRKSEPPPRSDSSVLTQTPVVPTLDLKLQHRNTHNSAPSSGCGVVLFDEIYVGPGSLNETKEPSEMRRPLVFIIGNWKSRSACTLPIPNNLYHAKV